MLAVEHQQIPFRPKPFEVDSTNPFYRYDPDQCILCGRCVAACQDVQVNETLSINWEDAHPRVLWDGGEKIEGSSCVSCGHCVTVCPCNALMEKSMLGRAGYLTGLPSTVLDSMIEGLVVLDLHNHVLLTNRAAADFDNIIAGPAPFATIYSDDFSETTPAFAGWTTTEGSWQRPGGLVRQSSTTGYARLTVGARTDDQVVQVRVRPTSFTEPDCWVGVLLRYQDVRNHTYLSLRGRGNISLWRRTNGAIQQIGTRSIAVATGTWYTLRVETVGGETRVFVNDTLQFTTTAELGPTNPDVQGQKGTVGLITQKSTADFDDFLAYQP
jgi:ferredoxin